VAWPANRNVKRYPASDSWRFRAHTLCNSTHGLVIPDGGRRDLKKRVHFEPCALCTALHLDVYSVEYVREKAFNSNPFITIGMGFLDDRLFSLLCSDFREFKISFCELCLIVVVVVVGFFGFGGDHTARSVMDIKFLFGLELEEN
jgi:hypothetical protein